MNLQLWKQRKKELKLTNQRIADIAKLPSTTVEQIMCGKVKKPRIDTVEAIERALGLDKPAETPTVTPPAADKETFEIVIKIILRGADDGR